jgi:hypothetical protein
MVIQFPEVSAMPFSAPRACRPDELDSLAGILDAVFRADRPGAMLTEYPQLFNLDNLDNLRVIDDGGRIASHVGIAVRDVLIAGCRLTAGLIGGVATRESARGHGLATALFDDAMRHIREVHGGCLMLVSGGRGLYRRRGCAAVPAGWRFHVDNAAASRLADPSLRCAVASDDDVTTSIPARCRREPARWVRPVSDYTGFLRSRTAMNKPSAFYLFMRGDRAEAHVLVSQMPEGPRAIEYAGCRAALAGGLGALMAQLGVTALDLVVPGSDPDLAAVLRFAGLAGAVDGCGTVRILDFQKFMELLRPAFIERLPAQQAARLSGEDRGEEMVFRLDGESWALAPGDAARVVFGSYPGDTPPVLPENSLGRALASAFPLTAPWYGMNYV